MEQPTPVKEKRTRQMTPELLEKLAVTRTLANQKRAENAKLKKMEKELKVKEQQTKAQEIKETYEKAITPEEPEEEPDEEPVQKPVKKKQTKKPKKPIVIVEESESDESEDEQVIYIKRSQTKKPAPQQQPQVSAQEIRNHQAYNALFNAPIRR